VRSDDIARPKALTDEGASETQGSGRRGRKCEVEVEVGRVSARKR
jgi:hypothetical protein